MPDDFDVAQDRETAFRESAIAQHRHAAAVAAQMPSRDICGCECGCRDKIPEARRKAAPGCKRCFTCQTSADQHGECQR